MNADGSTKFSLPPMTGEWEAGAVAPVCYSGVALDLNNLLESSHRYLPEGTRVGLTLSKSANIRTPDVRILRIIFDHGQKGEADSDYVQIESTDGPLVREVRLVFEKVRPEEAAMPFYRQFGVGRNDFRFELFGLEAEWGWQALVFKDAKTMVLEIFPPLSDGRKGDRALDGIGQLLHWKGH
jgi:hypothetical protein